MATKIRIPAPGGSTVVTLDPTPGAGAVGGTASARHIHNQVAPALAWTVNHNLGAYPQIDVFSPGRVQVEAAIVHVSENQALIQFNSPQSGFALCL